jgi:hypothetical protein
VKLFLQFLYTGNYDISGDASAQGNGPSTAAQLTTAEVAMELDETPADYSRE